MMISSCFFIFDSSFLLLTIKQEEMKAKDLASPPNGREAGKPMTGKAVPKLVLESAVEKALHPMALQLTTFIRLYWSKVLAISFIFCKRKFSAGS